MDDQRTFSSHEWPARSADINIMENIWKMLEDIIYDRSPIISVNELKKEIEKSFFHLNTTKRPVLINLYETFRKRLLNVIERKKNQRCMGIIVDNKNYSGQLKINI